MSRLELVATCAFGLESVLARELRDLGFDQVKPDNGQVRFESDELGLCRANLWLRTADRVWLRLGQFPARTFEELFEGTRALPWDRFLPRDANFPVEGASHASQLSSVPACQAIVKKAVVESLKAHHKLDWFPEDGPKFPIRVTLIRDMATLALDTSGTGLHKRGYRLLTSAAPLRETLAAGLVLLSYWNQDRLLLDPCCGSGTILLEAALIGLKRAPGLERDFASCHWPWLPSHLWDQARQEAQDVYDRSHTLSLYGSDSDGQVLRHARANLQRAGLEGRGIFFETRPVRELRSKRKYGVLITNPPYGERLSERREVEILYRELGQVVAPLMETWSVYILCAHPEFSAYFGLREQKRRKLYNGMIECSYYQYPGPKPPLREPPAAGDGA